MARRTRSAQRPRRSGWCCSRSRGSPRSWQQLLGGWVVGLGVAVVVGAIGLWWYLKPLEESTQQASTHVSAPDERRILVIANETVTGTELRGDDRADGRAGHRAHVLVVTPALNTKLRHWVSDEDKARAEAQRRLADSLARLAESGSMPAVRLAMPTRAVDRRQATDVRRRRSDHLHPPGGPVQLAGAGVVDTAREQFARCRSPTSSSTWRRRTQRERASRRRPSLGTSARRPV